MPLTPRSRPVPLLVLAASVACGCTREPSADPSYDARAAKRTLVAALDAWKAGKQNALSKRTPPIRFSDEDENDGSRLLEYELIAPDADLRPHEDVPVRLVLRDTRGRRVMRETAYQVALEPNLAVLRSEP